MKQEISCLKKKFGSDQSDQQPKSLASLSSFYNKDHKVEESSKKRGV